MFIAYNSIQVRLGYHDLGSSQDTCLLQQTVKVANVTVHEKFVMTRQYGRGDLINIGIIALLSHVSCIIYSVFTQYAV